MKKGIGFLLMAFVCLWGCSQSGFIALNMPLEEALTKTTFIVQWRGDHEPVEVIFQGENVYSTQDYIRRRKIHPHYSARMGFYKILTKYAVETDRYIFVPLDNNSGGTLTLRSLHVVSKNTLRTVDSQRLIERKGIWGMRVVDSATDTIQITYILKEDWRETFENSRHKAKQAHFRMLNGKLIDMEKP